MSRAELFELLLVGTLIVVGLAGNAISGWEGF